MFKPHVSAVTSMALDSAGETLATASEDSTVFFFSVKKDFEPIGFVNIEGPATHITWSPGSYVSHRPPLGMVPCVTRALLMALLLKTTSSFF